HRLADKELGRLYRAGCLRWRNRPFPTPGEHKASLCANAPEIGTARRGRRTIAVAGHYVIHSGQTQSDMPAHLEIEATTNHEAKFVNLMEGIGGKAVGADQRLKKWSDVSAAESNFWT